MTASEAVRRDFGEVLVRLAGERRSLLAVAGHDRSLISWFHDVWPERVLTVPPVASRVSVGRGVALGGGDAVVVLDEEVDAVPGSVNQSVLLVGDDPGQLRVAYRSGVAVCQAGWPGDLPALVVGALGAGEPVLLHLADPLEGMPVPADPPRTSFGRPRILHRGGDGMVVGAGPTAPAAALLAERLVGRGLRVTAVDSHTLPADSGVDAAVLQDHVLVGPLSAPRAGALRQVRVDPNDLAATTAAIAAELSGATR